MRGPQRDLNPFCGRSTPQPAKTALLVSARAGVEREVKFRLPPRVEFANLRFRKPSLNCFGNRKATGILALFTEPEIFVRRKLFGADHTRRRNQTVTSGESVRAAKGGYKLKRPPSKIFLGEIIRTIDGPLAPFEDAESLRRLVENDKAHSALFRVFLAVRNAAAGILDHTSLADVCRARR